MFICIYHKKALLILNRLIFLNISHSAAPLPNLKLILYFTYYFFLFSTFGTTNWHSDLNRSMIIEIDYYLIIFGYNLYPFEIISLCSFN